MAHLPPRVWVLTDDELITPCGRRISLAAIENWDKAAWGGNQAIITDKWRGWRVTQQYLVPPGHTIRTCAFNVLGMQAMVYHSEEERRMARNAEKRVLLGSE